MIVGFTGSELGPQSEKQRLQVEVLLFDWFIPGSEFHHGCCIGWDEVAAGTAKRIGYEVYGHPPTDTSKKSKFVNDFDFTPKSYLTRDRDIAISCERMIAAPYDMHEVLRSGTWATVRYAVKLQRPGNVVYRDGTIKPLHVALDLNPRRSWIRSPVA